MNQESSTHFRWVIVDLFFCITIINYVDRSSIAYAIDNIAQEFHLSHNQCGFILGSFGIGYFFTTFFGGLAADRYGAHKTLTFATILWGISTLLTGLAASFSIILMTRILLGLAEGPSFPCLAKANSEWLPETERNRALSASLIAVPLALAFGGFISTHLIQWFNWRGMYFILTAFTFIWVIIWWLMFRDKPEYSTHVHPQELKHIQHTRSTTNHSKITHTAHPWRFLLSHKTLISNNWAFFVFGFYLFFFMTWLPEYLHQTYHFELIKIGMYSMIPWLTAALFMWLMGTFSDWIFKKTQNLRWSRSYPIMASQLLSGLCIIPLTRVTSPESCIFFISLAVGCVMSANAPFYAVNVDIAKERVGTALGIMDAVAAIAGFLAPTLTGLIISWTGDFIMVFWLMALLSLSSVFIMAIWHNRH